MSRDQVTTPGTSGYPWAAEGRGIAKVDNFFPFCFFYYYFLKYSVSIRNGGFIRLKLLNSLHFLRLKLFVRNHEVPPYDGKWLG